MLGGTSMGMVVCITWTAPCMPMLPSMPAMNCTQTYKPVMLKDISDRLALNDLVFKQHSGCYNGPPACRQFSMELETLPAL